MLEEPSKNCNYAQECGLTLPSRVRTSYPCVELTMNTYTYQADK